jgi:hypothetical protein
MPIPLQAPGVGAPAAFPLGAPPAAAGVAAALTPAQHQLQMQQAILAQVQQQQQLQAMGMGMGGQPPAMGQMAPQQQQMQALQMMLMVQRHQQLQALQAQQQQMAAAAGGRPAAPYAPAGSPRRAGDAPPAKRQALSSAPPDPAQAQMLAQMQFRQLHAQGQLNHMNQQQQVAVFQSLFTRAMAGAAGAGGGGGAAAASARAQMRVAIDKRSRAAYDAGFQAVDTTDKDHADEVVRRCEEISKALRSHLGKGGAAEDGRFGDTDSDVAYAQVTQAQLIDACGDTARYLKPYQIVGVNFLMLLYRTRVGGGARRGGAGAGGRPVFCVLRAAGLPLSPSLLDRMHAQAWATLNCAPPKQAAPRPRVFPPPPLTPRPDPCPPLSASL